MISNLPEWYRIAAIGDLSEDVLEKRSSAIIEMINNDDAFLFNCVRVYLGKKVSSNEFDEQFYTGFNSKDGLYLKDTSLLEKRILSGAIIAQKLTNDSKLSDQLAYALVCGSFGIADTALINKDIITNAQLYLNHRSENERMTMPFVAEMPNIKEKTLSSDLASIEKTLNGYVKNIASYVDKQLKHSQKRIDRLQEESDVHWWLFRATSNLKAIPVAKLPSEQAPFILAYELSKLMTIVPAASNSASFLSKNLQEVADLPAKISIKQTAKILEDLNTDFANILNNNKYDNLTPLIFAANQRVQMEGNNAWLALFKMSAHVNADFSCTMQSIALQFFNELMLLSIQ
jgi:hypothetical protein